MSDPGKVVWAVGRALGKAVVAGLGLELARWTTQTFRRRLGLDEADDDEPVGTRQQARRRAPERAGADDVDALRRENARLREELAALRAEPQPSTTKPAP
jgi:hypothetical protein